MNDTSFGINNEGQLVFDYYYTDEDTLYNANVYNGQNSTLWVNFKQAFPDEIKETYQDLRSNGVLNYEELEDQFITHGSDKWSESIYNEDGDFKYISMLRSDNDATNLPQVRGTGEEHFRYFVENRLNFCDSRWYAGSYPNDIAVVRIYTPVDENNIPIADLAIPANASITVTPYSHMYAGVRYKANGTLYQERLEANEEYTFIAPNETFNDTETAIYGASQLSSLGDLAPLYLGYIDVGAATKLVELKIGDGTEGYQNNNLYHLAVGTNRLLKKIDIQNCIGFDQALVLTGCPNIEEVYAKGSSITGVELPDSGYLKVFQLPATISNLTMKNQLYVEDFSMEGYDNLKTILCENCPSIDTLTILNNAPNVERARLTNVDWEWDDASVLYELMERDIAGIDENGVNTDTMWIDGKCNIKNITGEEYTEIRRLYPYLELTYTTLTSNLIFMSDDGTTELCRQIIVNAGDGTDPVANGTIETPTKESTAQYHFTFNGWSTTPGGDAEDNALLKVEGNKIVYAAYDKLIRSYTVNFYNGTTLIGSEIVKYGENATYNVIPIKPDVDNPEDYEFIGWNPSPTYITGDMDCYAQYYDTRVIADDWTTIAENCLNGTATDKYTIGMFKPVTINYEDGTSETIDFEVIAHNHDELADDTNASWVTIFPHIGTANDSFFVYNDEIWGYRSGTLRQYKDGNISQNNFINPTGDVVKNYSWAIVFQNEIHMFSCVNAQSYIPYHYKYDSVNNAWVVASSIADVTDRISFRTSGIEYNGLLYYFHNNDDSNKSTYQTYDGTTWSDPYELPTRSVKNLPLIVYNNKLYIFLGTNCNKFYSFDGTTWTFICDAPKNMNNANLVIYKGELHCIGGNVNNTTWYKFNGSELIDAGMNTLTSNYSSYGKIVCYREKLYMSNVSDTSEEKIPITRLENPKAPLTFLAKNLLKDSRQFNSYNSGMHWSTSNLRTWCNDELYNSLPEELQLSISEIIKMSDTGYYGQSLENVNDKIWICSSDEMNVSTSSYLHLHGQGNYYPVFTDNDSRVRSKLNNESQSYWLRSTVKTSSSMVQLIYYQGSLGGTNANNPQGILVGFCI